jgi:hypothetical protein
MSKTADFDLTVQELCNVVQGYDKTMQTMAFIYAVTYLGITHEAMSEQRQDALPPIEGVEP